jgi:hypothetical protein
MKVYDSINWEFMIHCLHHFGFLAKFLSWIKECITSPRFSICLNGTLEGYFEGKRGLRQRDPLSSYLFVLVMEVFSKIMADHTGGVSGFRFHPRCLKQKLTHLCFADDLLIFFEVSVKSISIIKDVLNEFEELFGIKANPSKSFLFCSGVSERIKLLLLGDLRMNEGHFQLNILVFP